MFSLIGTVLKMAATLAVLVGSLLLSQGYDVAIPDNLSPSTITDVHVTKDGATVPLPDATEQAFTSLMMNLRTSLD